MHGVLKIVEQKRSTLMHAFLYAIYNTHLHVTCSGYIYMYIAHCGGMCVYSVSGHLLL